MARRSWPSLSTVGRDEIWVWKADAVLRLIAKRVSHSEIVRAAVRPSPCAYKSFRLLKRRKGWKAKRHTTGALSFAWSARRDVDPTRYELEERLTMSYAKWIAALGLLSSLFAV